MSDDKVTSKLFVLSDKTSSKAQRWVEELPLFLNGLTSKMPRKSIPENVAFRGSDFLTTKENVKRPVVEIVPEVDSNITSAPALEIAHQKYKKDITRVTNEFDIAFNNWVIDQDYVRAFIISWLDDQFKECFIKYSDTASPTGSIAHGYLELVKLLNLDDEILLTTLSSRFHKLSQTPTQNIMEYLKVASALEWDMLKYGLTKSDKEMAHAFIDGLFQPAYAEWFEKFLALGINQSFVEIKNHLEKLHRYNEARRNTVQDASKIGTSSHVTALLSTPFRPKTSSGSEFKSTGGNGNVSHCDLCYSTKHKLDSCPVCPTCKYFGHTECNPSRLQFSKNKQGPIPANGNRQAAITAVRAMDAAFRLKKSGNKDVTTTPSNFVTPAQLTGASPTSTFPTVAAFSAFSISSNPTRHDVLLPTNK